MKRIFSMLLVIAVILSCTLVLLSCADDQDTTTSSTNSTPSSTEQSKVPQHSHTYEGDWIVEEEGHYRVATCHPDAKDLNDHKDSVNRDGKCDVCFYVMKEPTTFTFTLKDNTGAPIQGATVKLYSNAEDNTVVTDENGNASHQFLYFSDVKVIVISTPEGYVSINDEIYVFSGTSIEVTTDKIVQ